MIKFIHFHRHLSSNYGFKGYIYTHTHTQNNSLKTVDVIAEGKTLKHMAQNACKIWKFRFCCCIIAKLNQVCVCVCYTQRSSTASRFKNVRIVIKVTLIMIDRNNVWQTYNRFLTSRELLQSFFVYLFVRML